MAQKTALPAQRRSCMALLFRRDVYNAPSNCNTVQPVYREDPR